MTVMEGSVGVLEKKKRVLCCGDTVRRDTAESVMRRWRVRQGYRGTAV